MRANQRSLVYRGYKRKEEIPSLTSSILLPIMTRPIRRRFLVFKDVTVKSFFSSFIVIVVSCLTNCFHGSFTVVHISRLNSKVARKEENSFKQLESFKCTLNFSISSPFFVKVWLSLSSRGQQRQCTKHRILSLHTVKHLRFQKQNDRVPNRIPSERIRFQICCWYRHYRCCFLVEHLRSKRSLFVRRNHVSVREHHLILRQYQYNLLLSVTPAHLEPDDAIGKGSDRSSMIPLIVQHR